MSYKQSENSEVPPPLPKAFLEQLRQLDVEPRHNGDSWRFHHQGRQLKAIYNHEAAADLKTFHQLDAEAELIACVLDTIQLELDTAVIGFDKALEKRGIR